MAVFRERRQGQRDCGGRGVAVGRMRRHQGSYHRVQSGGHNVPESEVRRRFTRSLGNLFRLYRPLLDTLHFFDNSSDTPNLIFKDEAGQTTINDGALYEQLRGRFAT